MKNTNHLFIYYNRDINLSANNYYLKMDDWEFAKKHYFYFDQTTISQAEVYLLAYLEDNEFYTMKIKEKLKPHGSKKKSSKKTPTKDDEFIDTETQDFLFDFKNETKNKFLYKTGRFIIYITKNMYLLEMLDLSNSVRTILHTGFKVMRIETNKRQYKRRGFMCDLLIIFGSEQILFVLLNVDGREKFIETVLHITDIDYLWDKVYFTEDGVMLVRDENSEMFKVDLDCLSNKP